MIACNGTDGTADYWGIFGDSTLDGDASNLYFRGTLIGCNVEDFFNTGIVFKNGSFANLIATTFIAGPNATDAKAVDAYATSGNGTLDASTVFDKKTGATWANSTPIHTYSTTQPFIQTGGNTSSPVISTYYSAQSGLSYPFQFITPVGSGYANTALQVDRLKTKGHIGTVVVPTYGASVAIAHNSGSNFVVTPTDGNGFTIANPTDVPRADSGQNITIRIVNSTGGALGTIAWGTKYKFGAAWTSPATGYSKALTFQFDGTNWNEVARSGVDGDTDDQVASEVPVTDTGDYFTSTDVETVLQEIGPTLTDSRDPNSHGNEAHDSTFITTGDIPANVSSLSKSGDTQLTGNVTLSAGSNITLTQSGQNIEIVSTASGTGDVVGPAGASDEAIARFDTTTGKLLQNSALSIDDAGTVLLKSTSATNGARIGRWTPDMASGTRYTGYYVSNNITAASPHASAGFASNATESFYSGGGTLSYLQGGYFTARNTGTGTVSSLIGLDVNTQNTSSGTVTTMYGLRLTTPTDTGIVGAMRGLSIQNQGLSGTTNTYGIYIEDQTTSTNPYAIYTGAGLVRLGGAVTNVSTTDLQGNLTVDRTDTITDETADSTDWGAVIDAGQAVDAAVTTSAGAGDAGKLVKTNGAGQVDDTFIPSTITRDSELATVATSGSYADLTSKPTNRDTFTLINPTDTDDPLIYRALAAMTITRLDCVALGGGTISVDVQECDANGASCASGGISVTAAATNASDTSFTDAAIDSGDWLKMVIGAPSGTVNQVACSLQWTE
jgi:hypothetical protein